MITKKGAKEIYLKNSWQKHSQPQAEKPKKPHTQHEAQDQTTLFEWAGLQRGKYPKLDDMFHIANGGYRDPREAANLKRQGVKAGVPDICLPVARGGYHGLYIELKYGKNKPTLEQQVWLGRLLRNGYEAKVCYGWEQAKNEIIKYLNLESEENMKLKKIEALCKQQKRVVIFDLPSGRWIGDGNAMYLVKDMPKMTKDELLSMFDVPEDKRNHFSFIEKCDVTEVNLNDTDQSEVILDRSEFGIDFHKHSYEPLETSKGISFICRDYLKPFDDKEQGYEIYERTAPDGTLYFAVKRGFLLVGIVFSMFFHTDAIKMWAAKFSELLNVAYAIREDEENRSSFFEEEEENAE